MNALFWPLKSDHDLFLKVFDPAWQESPKYVTASSFPQGLWYHIYSQVAKQWCLPEAVVSK